MRRPALLVVWWFAGCGGTSSPPDLVGDDGLGASTGLAATSEGSSDAATDDSGPEPGRDGRPDPVPHDAADDLDSADADDDGDDAGGEPDVGPHAGPTPDVWPVYQDVTLAAGIVAPHEALLSHHAIGQAWGDFDGDGREDLFVTGGAAPSRLFHNEGDGTFVQLVSPATDLVDAGTAGAVWADYDDDGFDDLS